MIPTGFQARVERDSVSPLGLRIVTVVATYPRFIHSEVMTYRNFSRNAASSRAIPVEKLIEAVERDPAMPVYWGKNQKGMQAREELQGEARYDAQYDWRDARDAAVAAAKRLLKHGLHKQITNRILEPFMWITTILTANLESWNHMFSQRCHPDAQPEFRKIAEMMHAAIQGSQPEELDYGEWHLPFRDNLVTYGTDLNKKISAARCARVSYTTHDGKRDVSEDLRLHDSLVSAKPGHWSPLEHVCTPIEWSGYYGDEDDMGERNLKGWRTLRYEVET